MTSENLDYIEEYDFVIVGAGIAGLTAAFFLANENRRVLLIDRDKNAGGLLKSEYLGGAYFDYGTHSMGETRVTELDEFLFSECTDNDYQITKLVNAGNYYNDQLNERNCTVDLSTLEEEIRNQCYYELLQTRESEDYESLEDFYISKYGQAVYENVFYDIAKKYFGEHPKKLHYSAGLLFDMSHVLAFNSDICESLKEVSRYNKILSHHVRVDGLIKHYPRRGGLSTFVEMLVKKVENAGVDVRLNSTLTSISMQGGAINGMTVNGKHIRLKHLVWTLPVGLFVFLSGLSDLKTTRPVFRCTTLFDYVFNKPLNSICNFINVYQPELISGRITIYENMGGSYEEDYYTCTVEVLSEQVLDNSYIDIIQQELGQIGIIDDSYDCKYSGIRTIESGFPVVYKDFVDNNSAAVSNVLNRVPNITLSGKGVGKCFFMGDVLRDIYRKVCGLI